MYMPTGRIIYSGGNTLVGHMRSAGRSLPTPALQKHNVLSVTVEGVVMVGVVVLSRRFHINPDNVATPIAASLGDLTTISLLAALARGLFSLVDTSSCAADTSCSEFSVCIMFIRTCVVWSCNG